MYNSKYEELVYSLGEAKCDKVNYSVNIKKPRFSSRP